MKARLAALKSGGAATSDAPVPSPPPPSETRARPSEDRGPRFATTLGNRSAALPVAAPKPSKPVIKPDEEKDNPYFDPKAIRVGRTSRALNFNLHGKYLEVGSKLRAEKKLEDIRKKLALQARRAGLDQNTERGFLVPAPGDVEWWDEGLLGDKTYDCIDDPSKLKIDGDDSLITIYVQHPVLLPPTQSALLQTVKPMYLTTKEQAKLRRMRRAAELKVSSLSAQTIPCFC
jgi:U4/U6 small nuclear ribonucleoprotein PRP3